MPRVTRAILPALFWMVVVFLASTDLGSGAHTSRIIEPLVRWFYPSISAQGLEWVHTLVRKAGHVTEYAVLALLILRALRMAQEVPVTRWSWPLALMALFASAAYGATDEFHQLFVPSRGPSGYDVLIDSCGALVGLTLAFWWNRRFESADPTEAAA